MNFSASLLFIFTALVAIATAFPSTVYAARSTTITASTTTATATASSVLFSSATQSAGCCHCELDTPAFNKTFAVPCVHKTANGTNTTMGYKGDGVGFKDNNHFVVALSISVAVAFVLALF